MASLSKMLDKCIAVARRGSKTEKWLAYDLESLKKLHIYTGISLAKIIANRIYAYSNIYHRSIESSSRHGMQDGYYNILQAAQYLVRMVYKSTPDRETWNNNEGEYSYGIFKDPFIDCLGSHDKIKFDMYTGFVYKKNNKYFYQVKEITINRYQKDYAEIIKNRRGIDIDAEIKKHGPLAIIVSNSRTFKGEMRLMALKKGNYRCVICGKTNKEAPLEIDHIKPWSKGGMTCIANSRVLCNECNIAVSNKQTY